MNEYGRAESDAGMPLLAGEAWLVKLRRNPGFRLLVGLGVPLLLAGALLLFRIVPVSGIGFFPCLFHQLTGFDCIGCGTTRALQALLHGDFAAAASYNVFMLIWLPLPAYSLLEEWLRAVRGRPVLPAIRDYRWLMVALAASGVLFFILRNLPWPPFDWLAA